VTGGVHKHSIEIAGHRTSITLEAEFWAALREIAEERRMTLRALVAEIDEGRGEHNLSSAIRLRVLAHYRAASGTAGRRKISNGDPS
jgi:predicted DNA-binding ribbon-helix-helix protein